MWTTEKVNDMHATILHPSLLFAQGSSMLDTDMYPRLSVSMDTKTYSRVRESSQC